MGHAVANCDIDTEQVSDGVIHGLLILYLTHEARNDTMESAALEAEFLFHGAQLTEVLDLKVNDFST